MATALNFIRRNHWYKMVIMDTRTFFLILASLLPTSILCQSDANTWYRSGSFYQVYPRWVRIDSNLLIFRVRFWLWFCELDHLKMITMMELAILMELPQNWSTSKTSKLMEFGFHPFIRAQWKISVMTSQISHKSNQNTEQWRTLKSWLQNAKVLAFGLSWILSPIIRKSFYILHQAL